MIGDSCIDEFVYCRTDRLAPDLPIPILEIITKVENPGMAANVHRNISQYYPDISLETNTNWRNYRKRRYVDAKTNYTFLRVDSNILIAPICENLSVSNYDFVIISDYDKGFLSCESIQRICQSHPRVFLDTKKTLDSWAKDAFIIKINDYEYRKSEGNLTQNLRDRLIRTLGSDGCEFRGTLYPVEKVNIADTSGAGDSFMAGLVVEFIKSGSIEQAIDFANKCASRVVQSRGVTTI